MARNIFRNSHSSAGTFPARTGDGQPFKVGGEGRQLRGSAGRGRYGVKIVAAFFVFGLFAVGAAEGLFIYSELIGILCRLHF